MGLPKSDEPPEKGPITPMRKVLAGVGAAGVGRVVVPVFVVVFVAELALVFEVVLAVVLVVAGGLVAGWVEGAWACNRLAVKPAHKAIQVRLPS
jgi:hypothetical protein